MPGSRDPLPTGRAGDLPRGQLVDTLAQVVRTRRKKAREKRERAADCRIWWRIDGFTGEIRQLEMMRIKGYIPMFCQRHRASEVVGVTVRQKNSLRSRTSAEARLGSFDDITGPAGQTCVDQDPSATGAANKINIRKTYRQPADIRRDVHDCSHDYGMIKSWPIFNFSGLSMFLLLA